MSFKPKRQPQALHSDMFSGHCSQMQWDQPTGQPHWELLRGTEWASPVAQQVKNPPASQEPQETQVWSLSWEDPLEKEMTTYSNILAWRISWTEEPGSLQSIGLQRIRHDWSDLACTYSTGNYIQYPVKNHHGKNMKKNVHVSRTELLCCAVEINTTL